MRPDRSVKKVNNASLFCVLSALDASADVPGSALAKVMSRKHCHNNRGGFSSMYQLVPLAVSTYRDYSVERRSILNDLAERMAQPYRASLVCNSREVGLIAREHYRGSSCS